MRQERVRGEKKTKGKKKMVKDGREARNVEVEKKMKRQRRMSECQKMLPHFLDLNALKNLSHL